MRVRKAVITAAGRGTRLYPASTTVQKEMFPLVDIDGVTKPTLQIIVEEALEAGIEEICIVTAPGDADMYRKHFRSLSTDLLPAFAGKGWALRESEQLARLEGTLHYVTQSSPEGYGHAVYCARDWVGDEAFLLLLGDHVYLSSDPARRRCARQLVDEFQWAAQPIASVKRTSERRLHLFGTVRGESLADRADLYRIAALAEKPDVAYAQRKLRTPGLETGEYLCFFGMHVLTPTIFDYLGYCISHEIREKGEFQLTSALAMLAERETYLAFEARGERYDMGIPSGLVETQLALALHSPMREEIVASVTRVLAAQGHSTPALATYSGAQTSSVDSA
ncbi:MAG: UTP--glucose-1-phosphate uridylyltransferase [Ktedonobacterales bacterium]